MRIQVDDFVFLQVLVTSLSLQQVEYDEPANFYIGPRAVSICLLHPGIIENEMSPWFIWIVSLVQSDLIHLGAKFAPCMRKDAKIIKEIEKGREKERETACCIRNDDSGCVQSSKADCSVSFITLLLIVHIWKNYILIKIYLKTILNF